MSVQVKLKHTKQGAAALLRPLATSSSQTPSPTKPHSPPFSVLRSDLLGFAVCVSKPSTVFHPRQAPLKKANYPSTLTTTTASDTHTFLLTLRVQVLHPFSYHHRSHL